MASILLPIQCWRRSSLIQTEGERASDSAHPGREERVRKCVCVCARKRESMNETENRATGTERDKDDGRRMRNDW